MNKLISLDGAEALQPLALLALRLYLGAFLIWGVSDNVVSAERMIEFVGFLTKLNTPWPAAAAPVSVYAQLAAGVLLALGLFGRWAALLMTLNFLVATVLFAGVGADMRAQYPHVVLVFTGLLLAATGPGPLSLDRLIAAGRAPQGLPLRTPGGLGL